MSNGDRVEYNANSRSCNVDLVNHDNSKGEEKTSGKYMQQSAGQGEQLCLFERSAKEWWNPRMDSVLLQNECESANTPIIKILLQHTLLFVSVSSWCWVIYFLSLSQSNLLNSWLFGAVWSVALSVVSLVAFVLIKRFSFQDHLPHLCILLLVVLYVTSLTAAYFIDDAVTGVGNYFLMLQAVLLTYLIFPFHPLLTLLISILYSSAFEVCSNLSVTNAQSLSLSPSYIASRCLIHITLHVVGCLLLLNIRVVRCSLFWKICHVVHSTQAKDRETAFKELMIKSVMPLSIADAVFKNTDDQPEQGGRLFRTFIMKQMDNVSILYADIVGFTKMSANKNAAELVGLLNDLFGRFDRLCEKTGCEKISTLGDCYYAVAGCPEPRADHAICCVEMGLGMVIAIREFCKDTGESVNMRVGVHTGRVLCGIVGTKRFKFDVWSNDVTLANGMEQYGAPGRIHVSQATLDCLQDKFEVEDSKLHERSEEFLERAGPSYFIVKRNEHQHGPRESTTPSVASVKIKNGTEPGQQQTSAPSDQQIDHAVDGNNSTAHDPLLNDKATAPGDVERRPSSSGDDKSQSNSDKQDQLMEYLGQCVSPLTTAGPGMLSKIRDDEDRKFVASVKKDKMFAESYRCADINPITLSFESSEMEAKYQRLCWEEAKSGQPILMFSSQRLRMIRDVSVSLLVTIIIFVCSSLLLQPSGEEDNVAWIVVFVIVVVFQILVVLAVGFAFCRSEPGLVNRNFSSALATCSSRHAIGGLMLVTPSAVICSHMMCQQRPPACSDFFILLALAVVQTVNYNQLSVWMRTFLAFIVSIIFVVLMLSSPCPVIYDFTIIGNATTSISPSLVKLLCRDRVSGSQRYEYILDVGLLLVFVWYIARHIEMGYRMMFRSDDRVRTTDHSMETEKRRVEALLANFIPPHVRKDMKDQAVYSKTHKKVGVIFASIVNFNELYEEDYAGGIEFIRVLSELISDVDDLLDLDKYTDIDKIKTIGTTMMLASGLNPKSDQETTARDSHLCRLMDFCMALQDAVDEFNKDMLNFQLVLRIGFNHGVVTAGVMGTTKRLYDIWGDTVNVSSRMDSTGVPGRIQVSEMSKKLLEDHFNFDYIGEKLVKGKGQMKTYLVVRDDEDKRVIVPNPRADYPLF